MELRRALLLFAIVLGVAAIVTSVSSPPDEQRKPSTAAPEPVPAPVFPEVPGAAGGDGPLLIRFDSEGAPREALVGTGRPATVTVSVERPGEVRIEGLGLSSPAEPLTPARFELLPSRPGRHPVLFTPAGAREDERIGLLRVARSS